MTDMQTAAKTVKERANEFGGWLERVMRAAQTPEISDAARGTEYSGQNPRGILAALRRGLSGREESRGPLWPYVAKYLDEREHATDRWFFVVGALAGWHPLTGAPKYQSLGEAARVLRDGSESMNAHFAALLACDERDLPHHLRHITALLAAHDTPVNWLRLLYDLVLDQGWRHPDRKVQSRWARDFYRTEYSSATASDTGSE
jgi:CRISPR type I-E-associated protein CasB/Cse2